MRTASRPTSRRCCSTVVRGGQKYAASGVLSKPHMARSSGTRRPDRWAARRTPSAIWSLAANTASRSGCRSSSACRPRSPLDANQSPSAIHESSPGRPASARASDQLARRSRTSHQSGGPEMKPTARRPCRTRCCVANLAPSRLAAAMMERPGRGAMLKKTIGGSRCRFAPSSHSRLSPISGTAQMMPSTWRPERVVSARCAWLRSSHGTSSRMME